MSLRFEQQRALYMTRELLRDILLPPAMKLKELRRRASSCLKHYPFLDERGKPMWSSDDFECPVIKEAK